MFFVKIFHHFLWIFFCEFTIDSDPSCSAHKFLPRVSTKKVRGYKNVSHKCQFYIVDQSERVRASIRSILGKFEKPAKKSILMRGKGPLEAEHCVIRVLKAHYKAHHPKYFWL